MKKILCVLMTITLLLVMCSCAGESVVTHEGELQPPITSSSASGKYYEDVVKQFETVGFTDVKTRENPDLITGWLTKDGEVDEVSINGDTEYYSDDWFTPDASVVVTYHTYSNKTDKSSDTDASKEKDADASKEKDTESVVEKAKNKIKEKINEKKDNNSNEEDEDVKESDESISDDTEESAASKTEFDKLDISTKNAYKSGLSYLNGLGGFSKQGLIEQLSSEYADGYTLEQAQNAVAALEADGKVDWKEQAVISAKNYMEFSSFSRSGLIDQLTSEYGEQFTWEEASYAADQMGLN